MTPVVRTQTGHEDLIHDAQLDYYGLRLATCSSDRVVKIFDVLSTNGSAPKVEFSCDLLGHTGPVWEVAWAHPRWGTLLASCSYDATLIIHRQQSETGVWDEAFRFSANSSINSLEWCPLEYGLALACASSDGYVSILRCDGQGIGNWGVEASFLVDKMGVNSVSWAPFGALGSENDQGSNVLRIACGGSDETVKVFTGEWTPQGEHCVWNAEKPEFVLKGHTGWIRDVSFCPSVGLPFNVLASCSEDGTVRMWTQEQLDRWDSIELCKMSGPVWRLAWSITGSILAVSSGNSDVTLWKQSVEDKKWIQVKQVADKKEERPSAPSSSSSIPVPPNATTTTTTTTTAPPPTTNEDDDDEDDIVLVHNPDQFLPEEKGAVVETTHVEESSEEKQQEKEPQQHPSESAPPLQEWDDQPLQDTQEGWDTQHAGAQEGWEQQAVPQEGWEQHPVGQEGWEQQPVAQEGWEEQPQYTAEEQAAWEQQQQQYQYTPEEQAAWEQEQWNLQQQQQQQQGWETGEQQMEWTPQQQQEWEAQQEQPSSSSGLAAPPLYAGNQQWHQ